MDGEGRRSDEQPPINPNIPSTDTPYSYFKFDKQRDKADEVRSALLVVAALVTAASYQAVANPPAAFKEKTPFLFIYANTLAWSSSLSIIELLTVSFPLKMEVRLSLFSMGFAYVSMAAAQANASSAYILLFVCILAPYLLRSAYTYKKSKCG